MPAPTLPLRIAQPTGTTPLAGVGIVDFTRVLAAPFGKQILADFGAEVIKIENTIGGDDTRMLKPDPALGGESPFFTALNRSKRSVAIDFKSEGVRGRVRTPRHRWTPPVFERFWVGERGETAEKRAGIGLPTPRDISPLALFLCGPYAIKMTGHILSLNGGLNTWRGGLYHDR